MTLIEDKWKKVIQDYHTRLDIFRQRFLLVQQLSAYSIRHKAKFENISRMPDFYERMEQLMRADAELVLDIRKNYSFLQGEIEIDLSEFAKVSQSLRFGQNMEFRGKVISKGEVLEIWRFLVDLSNFVKELNPHYFKIEQRVVIERQLIHQRTPDAFKKFIDAWQLEVNDEKQIIKLYNKVINRNHRLVLGGRTRLLEIAAASGIGFLFIAGGSLPTTFAGLCVGAFWAFRQFSSIERVEKDEFFHELSFLKELRQQKIVKAPPHDTFRFNNNKPTRNNTIS